MKKPKEESRLKFGNASITPTRGDNNYGYDSEKVRIRRKIEEAQEAKKLLNEWGIG